MPPLDTWPSWPFEGELRPKELAPLDPEPVLQGAGGVDCPACTKAEAEFARTSERWRLPAVTPGGLPLVLVLEPRAHHAAPADLSLELAREQGELLGRVERAVLRVPGVARVHVGKWGEGAEHLHWWFLARTAGFSQLRSSFAEIWGRRPPADPAGRLGREPRARRQRPPRTRMIGLRPSTSAPPLRRVAAR